MGLAQRRRFLIAASTAVVAAPFGLRAQPAGRVARIGVLASLPASNSAAIAALWAAFYAELKVRGWEEGRNLVAEARYTEGHAEKYSLFADELASSGVDLIAAFDSQAVDAVRKATRTIPIVMSNVISAVEAGYVASLAHPGGNITGVTNAAGEIGNKGVELFLSIRQDLRKMGLLWSPNNRGSGLGFKPMQDHASRLGLAVVSLPVDASAELGPALAKAQREGVQALYVHPTPAIFSGYRQIVDWAKQNRVMTGSISNVLARRGFLLSYGADFKDVWRITATFVDRILRGAKAAELPVEQPTKFEMIVNLKTSQALGLTIPQAVLLQADEVIQ